MFIKTLLNRVEDLKSFVYGPIQLEETGGEERLIVHLHPRKNGKPICSGCRKPAPQYDTRPQSRLFEYVPLWGIPVFFSCGMRRVDCPRCGAILTEEVPRARGKSRIEGGAAQEAVG